MDSPGSRPAEGHRWRRRRTDWYYIAGRGAHGSQFIRASRPNCQPAESSGMTRKGANQQEQVPCPQCGKRVQRRNLRKHERSQHDGVRRRRHACPFCKPGVHKTYSTFQDWKNHLHTTQMTRWTGRNTLPDSSWIDGSDSTTSRGTRTTEPISG